jgi:uncharacterized sulfatase
MNLIQRNWWCFTIAVCLGSVSGLAKPPNVILVVTDDQGYGDLGCHGNPWLSTPNLDRFHEEGVCLKDFHVDPVCTPTRAALLTGRHSLRTGAWHVVEGRQLLNREEVTMADVFGASGYRTAMFGKWHLGDLYPYAPQYRGFQEVVCHRAGGVNEIGNPVGNSYFDDVYYRNGIPEAFEGYCTDVWFDETLRFIDESRDISQPFFVYLALNAMHSPFTVAEEFSVPFREAGVPEARSLFFGMIANFDENFGRLMEALDRWGLAQDSLVIFMSDNGTAAGAAGTYGADDGFNAGMRGWKGSVHDGGHRVPCVVRWPAGLEGGHRVDPLTAHIDWLPTLIELCGLKSPEKLELDGRSMVSILGGDMDDWTERTLIVERQPDTITKSDPSVRSDDLVQTAVLRGPWRLVDGELFNIKEDPGQERDLSRQNAELVDELARAHDEWFRDVTQHQGAYTRFLVGHDQENPITLTVRDWHPTRGRVIWMPDQLSDDALFIDGFWAIDVVRAGRYGVRLARFPHDAPGPIGAASARLQVGEVTWTKEVEPEASSVTFEIELESGPALLKARFEEAETGRERGAYHVILQRR